MTNIIENLPIILKIIGIILFSGLIFYMMNNMEMRKVKQGQLYRNFFKTIANSYKITLFAINVKWIALSMLNLLIFLFYLFIVVWGVLLISAFATTNMIWIASTILFVIGVSLLLHVYVKWFNAYVFNPENEMNRKFTY